MNYGGLTLIDVESFEMEINEKAKHRVIRYSGAAKAARRS